MEWGTKGKRILLKNSNLSNSLFPKISASGFMVCIGGSNLFWNKSMWGQVLIFKKGKAGTMGGGCRYDGTMGAGCRSWGWIGDGGWGSDHQEIKHLIHFSFLGKFLFDC